MLKPNTLDLQQQVLTFEAIGTAWRISFEASRPSRDIRTAIQSLIDVFDQHYSRFRSDSLISRIAQAPGTHIMPADAEPLLNYYKQLYELTGGLVTPLIGRLMSDAGYDAEYSLTPSELHAVPSWNEALSYHSPVLRTFEPVLLDFGAAGKGYLVDRVAALLDEMNATDYVINAGGDIYASIPTRVALEHPTNTSEAIGIATVNKQAICGSAGNRRAWPGFTHIINPATFRSPQAITASWVMAQSAMIADGLATALFFTDAAVLRQRFNFSYAIVMQDGARYSSPDFPATFFKESHE